MKRVAVIGAGPAGLMAAEVLARRRRARDGLRPHAVGGTQAPDGGARRAQSDAQRGAGGVPARATERRAPHCAPPSRRFRRTRCARGAQSSDSRPMSDRAGGCFRVAMKASPLLRAWLRRLDAAGVRFALRHHWTGWDEAKRLTFATPDGAVTVEADATVLALGGASWPRLGSDGGWAGALTQAGVAVSPLKPSNCGFLVAWSEHLEASCRAAAEAHRPVVRRSRRARRSDHHRERDSKAARSMRCRLRCAMRSRHNGEATLHIALRPDIAPRLERRLDVAARQAVDLDLPAQGAQPVAGRDRPAAGSRPAGSSPPCRRPSLRASSTRCRSVSPASRRSRARSRPPAASRSTRLDARFMLRAPARRVRRGRDARLGSADRRLSAAGLLRDRRRGRARRAGVAGEGSPD